MARRIETLPLYCLTKRLGLTLHCQNQSITLNKITAMTKFILTLAALFPISFASFAQSYGTTSYGTSTYSNSYGANSSSTYVNGYTKSNGTYRGTIVVHGTRPTMTTILQLEILIPSLAHPVVVQRISQLAHITTEAVRQSTLDHEVVSITSTVTATKHTFQSVDNYIKNNFPWSIEERPSSKI